MRIFQHYDAEVAEAVCVNVLINVSIMQQFGRRRRLLCVELIKMDSQIDRHCNAMMGGGDAALVGAANIQIRVRDGRCAGF